MKAEVLVRDANESSCLVEVHYDVASFDFWFSYTKPIGPNTLGDCRRFGVNFLRLVDGEVNLIDLDFPAPILMPQIIMQAGNSGRGFVKSNGFLKTGKITWEIWNTRRTGKFGDNLMSETG